MYRFIYLILFLIFSCLSESVFAKDYNKGQLPNVANPAWVYPSNRQYYKGYEKKKNRMDNHRSWQYNTNRPTGKNKGGGTLDYYDYRSIRERTSKNEKNKQNQ